MAARRHRSEFERTFLPHLERAYSLARWLVRHSEDAEDMVQEAYLKAYRSFSNYKGGDSASYLLAIVRNTCLSHLRRAKMHRNVVSLRQRNDAEDDMAVQIEAFPDPAPLAEDALIEESERGRLRAAIWALPEQFREAIILREVEELSYAQIAHVTGVPVGTVMSRLARAREKLRELLEKEPNRGDYGHGVS